MMPRSSVSRARGSAIGNILTAILIIALLGLGAWLVLKDRGAKDGGATAGERLAPGGNRPGWRCADADRAGDRHAGARSGRAL